MTARCAWTRRAWRVCAIISPCRSATPHCSSPRASCARCAVFWRRDTLRTTSRWLLALLLACACATGGCSTLGYYAQAISGQVEIIRKSRPIPQVLSDPATSADLRQRLQRVLEIRDFASSQLALPDNDSYRRYADLNRKFVVWNVFAAPEFSLEPKAWCFPFAGCVG